MYVSSSTAAIILAAGSSSRMGGGRHKLLLPLDGRPVLAHVIDAALESYARPIVIVLGHQADQVRHFRFEALVDEVHKSKLTLCNLA